MFIGKFDAFISFSNEYKSTSEQHYILSIAESGISLHKEDSHSNNNNNGENGQGHRVNKHLFYGIIIVTSGLHFVIISAIGFLVSKIVQRKTWRHWAGSVTTSKESR